MSPPFSTRRRWLTLALAACAIVLPQLRGSLLAHDPVSSVTWVKDVEPIVRTRCLRCHAREGGFEPPLASFEDVTAARVAVKKAVLSRTMPVWAAVRGFGKFSNDSSLSPAQISTIASWIENGARRGDTSSPLSAHEPAVESDAVGPGSRVSVAIPAITSLDGLAHFRVVVPGKGRAFVTGWHLTTPDPTLRELAVRDAAGRALWTWLPGVAGEQFPAGTGLTLDLPASLNVTGRRTVTRPFKRGAGEMQIRITYDPQRALSSQMIRCGSRAEVRGDIHALRPNTAADGPIEVTSGDGDETRQVLGLFKRVRGDYPLRYWLRDAAVASASGRQFVEIAGSPSCSVELMTTPPERRGSRQR